MRSKVGPRDIVALGLVRDNERGKMGLIISFEISPGRPSQVLVEAPESILKEIADLANEGIEELAKRPPLRRMDNL